MRVFDKKSIRKIRFAKHPVGVRTIRVESFLAAIISRLSLTPDAQDRDLGGMVERRGVNGGVTKARVWVAGEIFRDWDQRFYLQVSIRA